MSVPLSFCYACSFNVEGHVTGFGNLTWAETHEAATRTAPCIKDVIKEGATLEGKTHMDDMAYRYSTLQLCCTKRGHEQAAVFLQLKCAR